MALVDSFQHVQRVFRRPDIFDRTAPWGARAFPPARTVTSLDARQDRMTAGLEARLAQYDVVTIHNSQSAIESLVYWLGGKAAATRSYSDPEMGIYALVAERKSDVLAIIDIDLFEDVEEAVALLSFLRQVRPEIPVLILSHFFARHDFGAERETIADCSMRLPATRTSLCDAIDVALGRARAPVLHA